MEIGDKLKDWELQSIFGDEVPIIDTLIGHPLLIVFFSLGCLGCLGRAIPYANRAVYENNDEIKVLGIHTDFHHTGYE